MVLQRQEIRVPFGGGVDQKTDHKQVIPGKLLSLINGEFTTIKQISKRNGFLAPYSHTTAGWYDNSSDTLVEAAAIYRRGSELLITARHDYRATGTVNRDSGWYVLSHDPVADEWKNIGTRQPLSLEVQTIVEPTSAWKIPDVALADSERYVCYAWLDIGDPADAAALRRGRLTVIDTANGSTLIDRWSTDIVPAIAATNVNGVHVVGIDDNFYAWFATATTNDIYLSIIDTADLTYPGTPAVKITDFNATSFLWDVCTHTLTGTGECSVVAYEDTTGPATDIRVKWFDDTGALVLTRVIDMTPLGAITVFNSYDDQAAEERVVVAWQADIDDKIYGQTYSAAGVAVGAPYVIINFAYVNGIRNITGCRDTASDFDVANSSFNRFYVEYPNDATNTRPDLCIVEQAICEFDGTNPDYQLVMPHCCLGSKAWEYEDKARVWVVHDSYGLLDAVPDPDLINGEIQNTYFLRSEQGDFQELEAPEGTRTDARCLGGNAGGQSDYPSLSRIVEPETNKFLFAGLRKDVITAPITTPWGARGGTSNDSVVGITTDFTETTQPSVELGPTAQTGGGYIGEADGRFQENNFHLYPESLVATVTAIGGAAVNWQYCVVYEWTDREGQIHQSQPSLPLDVSCNDGDHVDIEVNTLTQGDPLKLTEVRCVLYRTLDGPGDVFYRLPEEVHLLNSPFIAAGIVTLEDSIGAAAAYTDAVIEQRASLYTTGSTIGNICPPASSIMNIYQDRVMLVPDEDRTNIWFSKLKRNGIAVSFSDFFTKRIADGGDITAMVAMDSRQIVFKASEIRAFSGPGPNDLGQGTFGEDHLITTDVGCVDRGSVVWTDKGVMFKSAKGIYLLGRNLQVNYIGAPVEDFNQYRVIKSTLVENKNQVRFLLESSDMLVYDYLVNQWSVFEYPQSGEAHVPWDTVDSAIWQDNHVMIQDDATVLQESTDYLDILDTFIPLDLTSSWIKLNGLQGYQRTLWISLLGEVYGTCTINYEVYYDYVETNPQTGSVTIDAAFAADPPAQFKIKPRFGSGRNQAFKVRLYDAALAVPAGTQRGYAISDFMIEIGKLPGVKRQGGLKTR
jgi:hypothetical protein